MASPNFDFPRYPPPSPQVQPLPHPLPPSPDHSHTTVIVIVFVSFGGLFVLCFLAYGIFCLIKKRKMKKIVQKTELVHVDEHLKMKEAIVEGPHGPKAVVLEIEDDVHVGEEVVEKDEEKFKSGTASTMASSSSTSDDHNHLQLEHKA